MTIGRPIGFMNKCLCFCVLGYNWSDPDHVMVWTRYDINGDPSLGKMYIDKNRPLTVCSSYYMAVVRLLYSLNDCPAY